MNVTTTTQQNNQEENVKASSFGHRFTSIPIENRTAFSGENNKKGEETPKRQRISIKIEEPETFSDSVKAMIITKNKLCEIFSQYMNMLFSDYIGCNYTIHNQNGRYELEGYFSAEKKNNTGAITRAFDVIAKTSPSQHKPGIISNIVGGYNALNDTGQIFKVTQEGIDILSNIVLVENQNSNDIDKNGIIKNFNYGRYYYQMNDFQNINVNQQQYNMQYRGSTAPIYAVVVLDALKLLSTIYGSKDEETGSPVTYYMSIVNAGMGVESYMKNNPLFIILRTNDNDLKQTSVDIGAIPNIGNLEMH